MIDLHRNFIGDKWVFGGGKGRSHSLGEEGRYSAESVKTSFHGAK
jgi:hypothetical protein